VGYYSCIDAKKLLVKRKYKNMLEEKNDRELKINKSFFKCNFWKIVLILVLLVVSGVIFLVIYANKPNVSKNIRVVEKNETKVSDKIEYERFESNYISFRHTNSYLLKSHGEAKKENDLILETAFFSDSSVNSKKIALTIENLQSRAMSDSANYNMRKKFTDKYEEEEIKIGDSVAIIFSLKGGDIFEKTIFVPRKEYLVELTLSSPVTSIDQLNAEFEDIIKSIQWKK
jgi:Cu/Ag efflux protein CusF